MYYETVTSTLMDYVDTVAATATSTANEISNSSKFIWLSFIGINWSNPSWDLFILLFLLLAVLLYALTLGRDRIVSLIISTYVALAVVTNLPYTEAVSEYFVKIGWFKIQIAFFLLMFLLFFIIMSQKSLSFGLSAGRGKLWETILLAVLQIGLMICLIISFLPAKAIHHLSDITLLIFASQLGKFCWIILPIAVLLILKGRQKRISF